MRIGINLATQPFRRDRPILVASGILAVAMLGLLGVLIYLSVTERGALAEARHNVDVLERRLKRVSTEQQKLDAVLRRPDLRVPRGKCCADAYPAAETGSRCLLP